MQFSTLKSARIASLFGFFTSLAFGCVLSVGDGGKAGGECPEVNNHLEGDKCYCNDGYSWCNALDDDDLTCCLNTGDTSNNPTNNDTSNGTSDTLPTSGTGGTDATTDQPTDGGTTGTTPSNCVVEETPPASCDVEMGENYLCLAASDPACDVQGSEYYICEGGVWVPDTMSGDASCKFDLNNDAAFSYGCELKNGAISFVCGTGPGTACDASTATSCTSDTNIEYCLLGKLTSEDCLTRCQTIGQDNVTYDYGYCGEQEAETVCICCDEGEDGCPLGGGTTSGGGTTTGGESTGGGSDSSSSG